MATNMIQHLACIIVCLVLCSANASDPPREAILYPSDRSVLPSAGPVEVIAIASASSDAKALKVDGKPVDTQPMKFAPAWSLRLFPTSRPAREDGKQELLLKDKKGSALVVASVMLGPGKHTIEFGTARIELQVQAQNPAESNEYHAHRSVDARLEPGRCDRCHSMDQDGGVAVLGLAATPGSCQKCHEEVDLQLAHRHVLDPLSRCGMCHDPHGSTQKYLLVGPREVLCTTCHEGGHSKQ